MNSLRSPGLQQSNTSGTDDTRNTETVGTGNSRPTTNSNQLDRSPDSPCLHSGPNSAAPKIINPAHKPANQQRRSPGWNLAVTVPWKNAIGLAISQAGGPFKRWPTFPVVPLDEGDPYSISYPWVIRDDDKYRMWYGSNVRWEQKTKNMDGLPHVIKSAESIDAIHWEKQELVAIDTAGCDDIAAARPCVVRDPGLYRMWYCARGAQYSIYHAVSDDGVIWTQLGKDNGIDASPGEWDANLVGYPCVFDHKGQRFLIYPGDGYGRTGFGLAVLDD
ncbi:hypothetical protein NJB1907Z4_C23210 [Mycobacterium pseudoshottsii]|uniref:Glycosyl hydrolase family 32 N-terminal domain-containing protein n=1 Tax=Mycobacterium pseudoshottsii TaxID=265949 RepID=A0A9N7LPI6_9MYCO|nr:hypothetical protein NJB1907Z4_C23210 [Mycobacterium pseudoshottsii]